MNRQLLRILLIVSLMISSVIAVTMSIISFFTTLTIRPFADDFTTRTYIDSEKDTVENSVIESFTKNHDGFVLKYQLHTKLSNPYAGVLFEGRVWDLHKFDRVTIEINPDQCDPFSVVFADFVPGFSDSTNDLTWQIFEHEIIPRPGKSRYTIELEDFSTPIWWFAEFGQKLERSKDTHFKRVQQIQFQNHPVSAVNKPLQITVSKISFSHTPLQSAPFWMVSVGCIMALFAVRKRKSIPMPYHHLDGDESHLSADESRIVTFIGNHYARPDMTLSLVTLETGLSQKLIRKVLVLRFDKSFKQYLTDIRLQEARRLLTETDRLIADISLYVGYKHATTFTRLFREQFGHSPREFRDKLQK